MKSKQQMRIPEKYREIYEQAQALDSKLENEAKGNNKEKILIPRSLVVRHVKRLILLENEIEKTKKILKDYKIKIDDDIL